MTHRIQKALPIVVVLFLVVFPVYYFQIQVMSTVNVLNSPGKVGIGFLTVAGNLEIIISRLQWLIPILALVILTNEKFSDYGLIPAKIGSIGSDLIKITLQFGSLFLLMCVGIAVWSTLSGNDIFADSPIAPTTYQENLYFLIPLALVGIMINSFTEEFIFRSYLFEKVNTYLKNETVSLLTCSLLFGFGHLYEGILAALLMTILALVLGKTFIRNRSLISLVIFHSFWNFVVFMIAILTRAPA